MYRVNLDADDWIIDPDALHFQLNAMESDPGISFVFSPVTISERDDRAIVVKRAFSQDTIVPGEVAVKTAVMLGIIHTGPMMRMSAFRRFGGYNLDSRLACDVKVAIDLCGQGKVGYINRPLYAIFHHPGSVGSLGCISTLQADMCTAIESAFTGPLAGRIPNAASLRRRALNNAMLQDATHRIFNDQYYDGWSLLLDSIRRRPVTIFAVKPLLSVAARTVLGSTGWTRLLRILGKERAPASPIALRSVS
jgi:hypothetical protein